MGEPDPGISLARAPVRRLLLKDGRYYCGVLLVLLVEKKFLKEISLGLFLKGGLHISAFR